MEGMVPLPGHPYTCLLYSHCLSTIWYIYADYRCMCQRLRHNFTSYPLTEPASMVCSLNENFKLLTRTVDRPTITQVFVGVIVITHLRDVDVELFKKACLTEVRHWLNVHLLSRQCHKICLRFFTRSLSLNHDGLLDWTSYPAGTIHIPCMHVNS